MGLLLEAINYVIDTPKPGRIYFEGNINSYTYAEDGASLYDVLNLHNGKKKMIRDPLIKQMRNLEELEEYVEKTEDVQLKMMIEVVKEYGNRIPTIIKQIKEQHISDDNKDKADVVFSTVHRCKGMEYDEVELVNDFIKEGALKKMTSGEEAQKIDKVKLNEEINLLYVAITRAKTKLYIPETLLPSTYQPEGDCIEVLGVTEETVEEEIEGDLYFRPYPLANITLVLTK